MRRARVAIATAIIMGACAGAAQLSDAQYVEIARSTPEAREFYLKFPDAQATVDRSGRHAVDFRSGAGRLRVFVEGGRATEVFLDCPAGTIRSRDIVAGIRACG